MLDSRKILKSGKYKQFVNEKKLEKEIEDEDIPKKKSKLFRRKQKKIKLVSENVKSSKKSEKQVEIKDDDFFEKLESASKDLNYISETDAEVFPFIGEKSETVNQENLLKQIKADLSTQVEERDFEEFFVRLITMQDWFDDEHRRMAENFLRLKNLLKEKLKDLKVYKVGRIQIDIYIVGLNKDFKLMGVQTKAIET